MKKLISLMASIVGIIMIIPAVAMAKEKVGWLVVVAYTKDVKGLTLWWATLYKENMFLFTILTGCIVPVLGIFLGWVGDWAIRLTGIDVTKRELAEH
ncbi:MAG: hypothetical protein N3D84_03870 [Candidatus Woesearchaeota archaeon]|nr:hypothetical protein [Candidatus Woesearchaeota archaeon]